MSTEGEKPWWDALRPQAGGDVIIGQVGAGATGAAIGKNISQSVYQVLGEPTPDDKRLIEQQFAGVEAGLQRLKGQVDPSTAAMAEFQLKLLHGELAKTEPEAVPSASTITQVGDWLLEHLPSLAEAITGLFTTPAVGKVVGKAGEVAVDWVRQRFGGSGAPEAVQ